MSFLLVCCLATHAPIAPAGLRWCTTCGAEVWVSHSMLRKVDVGDVTPACEDCAQPLISQPGQHAMVHPDQVSELRSLGLLSIAHQVVEVVNSRQRRPRRR